MIQWNIQWEEDPEDSEISDMGLSQYIAIQSAIYGAKRLAHLLAEHSDLHEKAQQAHDEWTTDHNDEHKTDHYHAAAAAFERSDDQLQQLIAFIEAQ